MYYKPWKLVPVESEGYADVPEDDEGDILPARYLLLDAYGEEILQSSPDSGREAVAYLDRETAEAIVAAVNGDAVADLVTCIKLIMDLPDISERFRKRCRRALLKAGL